MVKGYPATPAASGTFRLPVTITPRSSPGFFFICRSQHAYINVNKSEVYPKGKFVSFNLLLHLYIGIAMQLLHGEAVKPRHICLWIPFFYSSSLVSFTSPFIFYHGAAQSLSRQNCWAHCST